MAKPKAPKYAPVFDGFVELAALWDAEGGNPPLFPSQGSARNFIEKHRAALINDEALAYDLGRILVDVDRVKTLRRRVALEDARRRLAA